MLRKIECYIHPSSLDSLADALVAEGVEGMSVSETKGFGRRAEFTDHKAPGLLPRLKLEMVVPEEIVEKVISLIRKQAGAGTIGAGKVFVIPVEDAVRLSTREAGKSAIW